MKERFDKLVEFIGDKIDRGDLDCFDIGDFWMFREYILNWDMVKLSVYEENNDGISYKWDDVKFVEGV
jgi:hypothetical protein